MRLLFVVALGALALAGCTDAVEPMADRGRDVPTAAQPDEPQDLSFYGVNGDPFLGNASASVQVVSFEAPGCSNCRAYHFNHLPGVLADFVETQQIGYHFLQFQVGYSYDITGGIAAECVHREGGSGAYVHIMDLIFGDQRSSRLPEYLDNTIEAFALDADVVHACFDGKETEDEVWADIQAGYDSGAGSNPGFAIISEAGVEIVKGSQGPRAAIERALA